MGDSSQSEKLPWQQEALNLVWKQKAPGNWKVFSGKKALLPAYRKSVIYAIPIAILLVGFFCSFLAFIVFTGGYTSGKGIGETHHAPLWPGLNGLLYWLVVGGVIIILALVMAFMMRQGTALKQQKDPQPLVIVLPEGWVHYLSPEESTDAIAFAELAELQGKSDPDPQEVTTLAELQRAADPSEEHSSSSDKKRPATSLYLQWREEKDKKETWAPHECFGAPEPICAAILAVYATYLARSEGAS